MDHLLHVLRVKGRATPEALEAAVQTDPTRALDALAAAGLVESTKLGYRITELGNSRVEKLYERERTLAGPVVNQVYESFAPINGEVKQICTDWQMRSVGGSMTLNDHSDPHYDSQVLARLRRTDAKVPGALAPLTLALTRFELYPRRLQLALARLDAGDHSMLAAPLKDSYHTVWFELHEELLILSGRARTE